KGDSASSTTLPTPTPTTTAESAPRLSVSAKGGDEVRESGGESEKEKETSKEEEVASDDLHDAFIPYGGLSDIGSPRVDGPLVMPEDPYAYVVAAFQAPPSPDYPLLAAASPTAESPGYIDESDPEEDPEEDHVDYPIDGGEEGDDEDEDVDIERDEKEDEYLAHADSKAVALLAIDHAPSAEETKPFETDESATTPPPHPTYRVTARMSIRPQTFITLPSDTEITRLMVPLGYRAAKLRWRDEREEIPEADLPHRKRLCTAARHKEPVRDNLYRSHPGDCIDHRGGGHSEGDRAFYHF
nr:hypothetical protein [Tanacetum cinerariifolium]